MLKAKTMNQKESNLFCAVTKNIFLKVLWVLHYLSWAYRYIRLILGFNTLRDIKILSIEFCSICNLQCKYCFIEKKERSRYLDINLYEKLIKEVSENPKYKIQTMEWPISGEFLIYPEHKQVVEITKRYMERYPHFRPHVILNENMVLMNKEKIDLILKSGVVKQIICSIDGHDRESLEEMRPPAKFHVVFKNMRLLFERNKELGNPVFIQINNGRDGDSWGKEFSAEMKEILRLADGVTFWKPKYWNESFNKSDKQFFPAKGFCTFVFNNVTLSSSGLVSKCCMDLKGSTGYVDLREQTLEFIWHSQVRKQFLTAMFQNKRHQLDGCRTCSITCTNNDNRYSNIFKVLKRKFPLLTGQGNFYSLLKD